jgi:hypothetical protein
MSGNKGAGGPVEELADEGGIAPPGSRLAAIRLGFLALYT